MRVDSGTAGRLFGAVVSAAVVAGCGILPGGDTARVESENPALAAAFDQLQESRGSARLGDVVADSGIGIGPWERMYTFYSPVHADKVNAVLGTGKLRWKGLPQDSDSAIQVFVGGGKVVYAFDDRIPRHGVGTRKYATPDSMVRAKEVPASGPMADGPVWVLDIDQFS